MDPKEIVENPKFIFLLLNIVLARTKQRLDYAGTKADVRISRCMYAVHINDAERGRGKLATVRVAWRAEGVSQSVTVKVRWYRSWCLAVIFGSALPGSDYTVDIRQLENLLSRPLK
ncbi:MAG TPA: hypothetical protein VGM08_03065 [Candidatus Saccharimonadales bacterium]|jgi:hypothetical protein